MCPPFAICPGRLQALLCSYTDGMPMHANLLGNMVFSMHANPTCNPQSCSTVENMSRSLPMILPYRLIYAAVTLGVLWCLVCALVPHQGSARCMAVATRFQCAGQGCQIRDMGWVDEDRCRGADAGRCAWAAPGQDHRQEPDVANCWYIDVDTY